MNNTKKDMQTKNRLAGAIARLGANLNVYYDVPASDLLLDAKCSSDRISHVVCLGDEVLIALNKPELDEAEKDVLYSWVRQEVTKRTPSTQEEDVDAVFDYQLHNIGFVRKEQALMRYRQRFNHGTCLLKPVPVETQIKLSRMKLIEPFKQNELWGPTSFGMECGLVIGCLSKNDGRVCCVPCWSKNTHMRVKRACSWGKDNMEWERVPLKKRIQRLQNGLPSNSAYSKSIVETFGNIPLEDYLKDYKEEYARLMECLPPAAITYQQAAFHIYKMLQNPATKKVGTELMHLLAEPLAEK